MIFFSQKLVDDSLKSRKADPRRMVVGHWGADLDFYDRISRSVAEARQASAHEGGAEAPVFIATGKEQRDQPTLIEAFRNTSHHLILYIGINADPSIPNPNLDAVRRCHPSANVKVVEICGLLPYEIACEVAKASCVVICCKETRYTAGLTTVVEALALGLPIICSRNPQIPVDFSRDGCGISVPYGDVEGWQRAVDYIATHPEEARRMGEKGRQIAEQTFNDKRCAEEIANIIKSAL